MMAAAGGGNGAAGGIALDWIAVDWGTSRLRAWAMGAGEAPLAVAESDRGMGTLAPAEFEPALIEAVGPWLAPGRRLPVVACGMVGARQGWIEAPYAGVPCPPLAAGVAAPVRDPRIAVRVVPGLSQARPPDVIRGEETQIAGLLARRPGFDGVVCLPGTHTKWVHVSAGEVVSFATAMTGELFALLAGRSVLRHSVGEGAGGGEDGGEDGGGDWDEAAFAEAVAETLSRPERLAVRLFGIRAEGLLAGLAAGAARARLSGLLLGAELAAVRPYWLGQAVVIVGAPRLAAAYRAALGLQGLEAEAADADALTRAGLARARAQWEEAA